MKTSNGYRSIRNKHIYLKDQLNKYGFFKALFIIFFEFYQKKIFNKKAVVFPDFSKNLTNTISSSSHGDAHENKESSYFSILKAFRQIPISSTKIRLLDIGCGSGKSMVIGMKSNFLEVIGVDLDIESLEQGMSNCEQMKSHGYKTSFLFINNDATSYSIPEGINLIYLFNPFGIETLKQVVENIETFVKKQQHVVYVVYMNPKYIDCFLEKGLFNIHFSSSFRNTKNKEMIILKSVII